LKLLSDVSCWPYDAGDPSDPGFAMLKSFPIRLIGTACAIAGVSLAAAALTPNDAQSAQPPCNCVSSHPFRVAVPAIVRTEPQGALPVLDGCSADEIAYEQVLLAKASWLVTDLINFAMAADTFSKNPSAQNGNTVWWTASFVSGTANELKQLAPPAGSPWASFAQAIEGGWTGFGTGMGFMQEWSKEGDPNYLTKAQSQFENAVENFVPAGMLAPKCPNLPEFALPPGLEGFALP